ncbi:site-specific integrase [Micromonospora sp. NPDC005161]
MPTPPEYDIAASRPAGVPIGAKPQTSGSGANSREGRLRQVEVLGLRWEDVDLTAGTLRVRGQLQRDPDSGGLVFVETKTARSRRTLPLPSTVLAALCHHQQSQAAERLEADRWADPGLVFATSVGTPIHPRNDYRSFREIIRPAGLRQVRLHDLRHTAASVLLAQGVPARVVMEILGHSQISVTLNIYAHVAPEIAREAASRLEGALWSGVSEPWLL